MDNVIEENSLDLRPFAKYLWWKSVEQATKDSHQLIAQVMSLGTFEDVQKLRSILSDDRLVGTLEDAEPGEFRPRSWAYWHWVLNGFHDETLPPLPRRTFGEDL